MKITVDRVEGPAKECGMAEFSDFAATNAKLSAWGRSAPKGGTYDKVDVKLHLDGDLGFGFRFDMTRENTQPADLKQEALDHAKFYAGMWCPAHMSQDDYSKFLEAYVPPVRREHYQACVAFLTALTEAA